MTASETWDDCGGEVGVKVYLRNGSDSEIVRNVSTIFVVAAAAAAVPYEVSETAQPGDGRHDSIFTHQCLSFGYIEAKAACSSVATVAVCGSKEALAGN